MGLKERSELIPPDQDPPAEVGVEVLVPDQMTGYLNVNCWYRE